MRAQVECTVDARPRPHVWIVRRARLRVDGGALNTIEQKGATKGGGDACEGWYSGRGKSGMDGQEG
jgi:hypothetical protein